MTAAERIAILERIIRSSQDMRDRARRARLDVIGLLLENVLHEARSTVIGEGHELLPAAPPLAQQSGVVGTLTVTL